MKIFLGIVLLVVTRAHIFIKKIKSPGHEIEKSIYQ